MMYQEVTKMPLSSSRKSKIDFVILLFGASLLSAILHYAIIVVNDSIADPLEVEPPRKVTLSKKSNMPYVSETPNNRHNKLPDEGIGEKADEVLADSKEVSENIPEKVIKDFERRNTIIVRNLPDNELDIFESGLSLLYVSFSGNNAPLYSVRTQSGMLERIEKEEISERYGKNIILINDPVFRNSLISAQDLSAINTNVAILLDQMALRRIVKALGKAGIDANKVKNKTIELLFDKESLSWELIAIKNDKLSSVQ